MTDTQKKALWLVTFLFLFFTFFTSVAVQSTARDHMKVIHNLNSTIAVYDSAYNQLWEVYRESCLLKDQQGLQGQVPGGRRDDTTMGTRDRDLHRTSQAF